MTATGEELKQALSDLAQLSSNKTAAMSPEASMDLLSQASRMFLVLKRANRSVHLEALQQRERVGEERNKVDLARLALQNLKYEESMLEQEVKSCQGFQSIYQDIPLHSLAEFKAASADSDIPDESSPHALMLARLHFELAERKRLQDHKLKRQQERNDVVKDNKLKKAKLEYVERSLKDLSAAANSIQTRLENF